MRRCRVQGIAARQESNRFCAGHATAVDPRLFGAGNELFSLRVQKWAVRCKRLQFGLFAVGLGVQTFAIPRLHGVARASAPQRRCVPRYTRSGASDAIVGP